MSLRKSPQPTPALADVSRQNSTHSTGPRSPAGKARIKLNALLHGRYTTPENERAAMLALGEDPAEFERFQRDLMATYGPGDSLWDRQLEDLAKLYWRRRRIERLQAGVRRRALLEVEERQHQRQREMAQASFEPSRLEMLEVLIPESTDPGVRARRTLSYLGVMCTLVPCLTKEELGLVQAPLLAQEGSEAGLVQAPLLAQEGPGVVSGAAEAATHHPLPPPQLRRGIPLPVRLASLLDNLYRNGMGWRTARTRCLLRAFSGSLSGDGSGEAERRELLSLLEEEIADQQKELEHAEKVYQQKVAIERDACLGPADPDWASLLRQEAALDRSIDRKVRIILAMRKEYFRLYAIVNNPLADDPDEPMDLDIDEPTGILSAEETVQT